MDETYCRLNGRWAYCYRAIDEHGQVIDVYVSERPNAAAARAFFERAVAETGTTPERVVPDKALCCPPALRSLLPDAEHRTSKFLNNGLERDHGHLQQPLRSMRGFKQCASANGFSRGHALVQYLRNGCSSPTDQMPRPLRLATAWPQLAPGDLSATRGLAQDPLQRTTRLHRPPSSLQQNRPVDGARAVRALCARDRSGRPLAA